MFRYSRLLLAALVLSGAVGAGAQEILSADVQRMQESARSYLDRGDYGNAVMMYSQAIRQAPDNVSLRRDLAYTYFLSGDAKKAKEIIDPVIASGAADEQSYQVAGAVDNVLGNSGRAKRLLNEGLAKYPNSGLLYNSKGNLMNNDKNRKNALKVYNSGIKVDPSYPMNYYNAAKIYYINDEPAWALLYGEIFVNIEPASSRTSEIKKMMIDAYRKLFSPGKDEKLPAFNASAEGGQKGDNFASLYRQVMIHNAAAISQGLNTENLIMLRTRFILEWSRNYSLSYPFTLFSYQEKMLHEGVFDAYNQWLFGAVDNSQDFSLWIKANSKEFGAFETWRNRNPLQPAVYDPAPGS